MRDLQNLIKAVVDYAIKIRLFF